MLGLNSRFELGWKTLNALFAALPPAAVRPQTHCGSEFIREDVVSGTERVGCADPFANEFAPTKQLGD